MKILVCGSRHWEDRALIARTLADKGCGYAPVKVIHGDCRGADRMAGEYAEHQGCSVFKFPADWTKYGRAAGPIRNQQMLDEGKPDLVLAFHDDIERSKGTKDMVIRARNAGIPVEIISHASQDQ